MKALDIQEAVNAIRSEIDMRKGEGGLMALAVEGLTSQSAAEKVAEAAGVILCAVGKDGAVFLWRAEPEPGGRDDTESDGETGADGHTEASEVADEGLADIGDVSGEAADTDLPPRWRWIDRATDVEPRWHAVLDMDRDYRLDGDRYIESKAHKAYRLVAEAGAALADAEGLSTCYPAFGLFMDDLATSLLSADGDQSPLAADLARRSRYFYGRAARDGAGSRHPSAAWAIAKISRMGWLRRAAEDDDAERYPFWHQGDAVARIREAVREPGYHSLHRVADCLADIAVDALYAGVPEDAEGLAREAVALYMLEFDVGEANDFSAIAHCHGLLGWAKADQGEWHEALGAYRESLKWHRAAQAVNPDSSWIYCEDVADACYCVAFLSGDMRSSRELLLEAARIYSRGIDDERNVSGLIRSYLLLAELEDEWSGPSDAVQSALYRTKAESIRSRLSENGIECCRSRQLDESLNGLLSRSSPAGLWHGSHDVPF